jgi:hypothetical protein
VQTACLFQETAALCGTERLPNPTARLAGGAGSAATLSFLFFSLLFFAHTRQSPLTLAAAPCARLRERGSTLCLCHHTDHQAGPRIRKQDRWELGGHGQYVPPRLPPPQASISYAADGYSMLRYWIRRCSAISYVFGDVRHCEPTTFEPYL